MKPVGASQPTTPLRSTRPAVVIRHRAASPRAVFSMTGNTSELGRSSKCGGIQQGWPLADFLRAEAYERVLDTAWRGTHNKGKRLAGVVSSEPKMGYSR